MKPLILITAEYRNNSDITFPTLYIAVLMVYWHCVLYYLKLTKPRANAVYVFLYLMMFPEVG